MTLTILALALLLCAAYCPWLRRDNESLCALLSRQSARLTWCESELRGEPVRIWCAGNNAMLLAWFRDHPTPRYTDHIAIPGEIDVDYGVVPVSRIALDSSPNDSRSPSS